MWCPELIKQKRDEKSGFIIIINRQQKNELNKKLNIFYIGARGEFDLMVGIIIHVNQLAKKKKASSSICSPDLMRCCAVLLLGLINIDPA